MIEDDRLGGSGIGGTAAVTADIAEAVAQMLSRSIDLLLVKASIDRGRFAAMLRELRQRGCGASVAVFGTRASAPEGACLLDSGADVWLDIDSPTALLVAQSRALARRRAPSPTILECDDLRLDVRTNHVTRAQRRVWLGPKQCQLLYLLMSRRGRVVTLADMAREVWGHDELQSTDTYKHAIHSLRKKLDEHGKPQLLHTVWGRGYRLGRID